MNDFQIISKLGEGAYSVVYKARRLVDGNVYALKKVKLLNLSDKEKQNALNEVRILASVKSNYVVSYKEAFFEESESCLGIVMEYADKGDLYQKITEFKKAGVFFEESDIWRIFIQMVRGLKALHDLKILHRDLKSANIFLFTDGTAKLGDMNVSKVARRGLGYTQTGTPYYARFDHFYFSPEVWKDQPYDSKSDIWSLGCVLYEMTSLKPPFRAENMEGLYKKVINGHFSKIPEKFSNDLWEILKCLLTVQPESRLSCGKEMLYLEQILKHPVIVKRIEIFKAHEENEDSNLLQTIRIPKNLLFLTERLPKANYNKQVKTFTKKADNDLPEIGKVKKKKKDSKLLGDGVYPEKHGNETEKKEEDNLRAKNIEPETPKKIEMPEEIKKIKHKGSIDNSIIRSPQKKAKNPDNSIEAGYIDSKENSGNNMLPVIKSNSNHNEYKYDLPSINIAKDKRQKYSDNEAKHISKKNDPYHASKGSNGSLGKILPYVNNEHISNVYKYAPSYLKQSPSKNVIKYGVSNEKSLIYKNHGYNYLEKKGVNLELIGHNNGKLPVIPNRKLSPIRRQIKV